MAVYYIFCAITGILAGSLADSTEEWLLYTMIAVLVDILFYIIFTK